LNRIQKRKRKQKIRKVVGLTAAVIVAAAILTVVIKLIVVREQSRDKSGIEQPDFVTQELLIVNEYSRPGRALKQINGIVIHYVGNPGTSAQNNRNYFNNLAVTKTTYASSHYIVGLEGEVIQCVPLDEISFCSNNRNDDTVAIECCHPDETGEFNEDTYASLVKLAGWLCWKFDLEDDQVIRHYDVKGKLCPLYYVEHEDAWEQMKEDIMVSKAEWAKEN